MQSQFSAIYLEHQALLRRTAARVAATTSCKDVDALVSVGGIALWQANLKFDPALGLPLWAYAYKRVWGSMIDEVRGMDGVSRHGRLVAHLAGEEYVAPVIVDIEHAKELAGDDNPEENVHERDVAKLVRGALARLPERHAEIIRRCYWECKTLNAIGEEYALSEGRVCQIKTVALAELRAILAASA